MKFAHYLTLRGGIYQWRKRFPTDLIPHLNGRAEFKRSLKTDSRQEAIRRLPPVLQEYFAIEEQARAKKAVAEAQAPRQLSDTDVMLLVSQWHAEAKAMYQERFAPVGPETKTATEESVTASLDTKRQALQRRDYAVVLPLLKGLLSRHNLSADPASAAYNKLAYTLLRAWITLEEIELHRLQGNFASGPRDNILSLLQETLKDHEANGPQRTLKDLIKGFTEDKGKLWRPSTQNAVRAATDFLTDLWGEKKPLLEIDRAAGRGAAAAVGLRLDLSLLVGSSVPSCFLAPSISDQTVNRAWLLAQHPVCRCTE